ncbi:TPA: hypothetical protein WIF14_002066, partial [Neisseria meningitidis]
VGKCFDVQAAHRHGTARRPANQSEPCCPEGRGIMMKPAENRRFFAAV